MRYEKSPSLGNPPTKNLITAVHMQMERLCSFVHRTIRNLVKKPTPPELDDFEREIYELSQSRLDVTDHDVLKWQCAVQGCQHFNRVKDYGISPYYRWRKGWINLDAHIYYCGKHWKMYKAGQEKTFVFKLGNGRHHLVPDS